MRRMQHSSINMNSTQSLLSGAAPKQCGASRGRLCRISVVEGCQTTFGPNVCLMVILPHPQLSTVSGINRNIAATMYNLGPVVSPADIGLLSSEA